MDFKDRSEMLGASKGVIAPRKTRKKTTRRRPQSAPAVPKSTSCAVECPSGDRYHATSFPLFSGSLPRTLERSDRYLDNTHSYTYSQGRIQTQTFPFQDLPDCCKLKAFSFLSNVEKARSSLVCKDWNLLVTTPRLWNHVLFSILPLGCLPSADHEKQDQCYDCYRKRVFLFASYLISIKPILNSFEFKLDIADAKMKYLLLVENVLHKSKCSDLRYANINWKETPALPFWLENHHQNDVIQNHRHRQRLFVHFFNDFTTLAPNIETLILPFDWSENSVEYLIRLKGLHSLVLEKYFVFQFLDQKLLSRLLKNLPNLTRLMLEVWTPSGQGLVTFQLSSKSIVYLDISQSRGFYVQKLNMPKLRNFRIARHPWNGPLVMAEKINLPCLYDILTRGAPLLETVNDHRLAAGWQDGITDELDHVLKTVCSCKKHKSGWALY